MDYRNPLNHVIGIRIANRDRRQWSESGLLRRVYGGLSGENTGNDESKVNFPEGKKFKEMKDQECWKAFLCVFEINNNGDGNYWKECQ